MSDEDLRRAIEFLVEQQWRYNARLDHDEARLTRLEDAFALLAELARNASKKTTNARLSNAMDDLAKSMIRLAKRAQEKPLDTKMRPAS